MGERTYEPPVPFARLHEMIEALQSDDSLSKEFRAEVALALDTLFVIQLIEERATRRGRHENLTQRGRAHVVHRLVTEYGVRPRQAARAVSVKQKGGDLSLYESAIKNLLKCYRTMKKADEFSRWSTSDELVMKAAARLARHGSPPRKRK